MLPLPSPHVKVDLKCKNHDELFIFPRQGHCFIFFSTLQKWRFVHISDSYLLFKTKAEKSMHAFSIALGKLHRDRMKPIFWYNDKKYSSEK